MKRVLTGILLLCGLLTSPLAGAANPTSEHLQWGRWSFDYEVRDNTGLALMRMGLHAELSAFDHHVALALDGTSFTDRQLPGLGKLRPSELDATADLIGRWEPLELHLALERDLPLDRRGLVQQVVYALAVWSFELLPHAPPAPPAAPAQHVG